MAAGNNGRNGLSSVGSPCVSKNSICVGTTENQPSAFAAQRDEPWSAKLYTETVPTPLEIGIRGASFGIASYLINQFMLTLVRMTPADGCVLSKGGQTRLDGMAVLIDRGNCLFTVKVRCVSCA